jgi:hypothetical protein
MASGLLVGVSLKPADTPPCIQSDKYQCRTDTVISPDDVHVAARNIQRRDINILSKIVHLVGFICKIARYFSPILTKFGFPQQIFTKVPNIKFYENPSDGRRADMYGQTDGVI